MQRVDPQSIRLTETVKKGGCAAKLPAGELKKILARLKFKHPKELIIGTETMDDACVWDLGDGQSLIQTLDFFTPIVDDPYDFGAIAAANALSDVYAMDGEPKVTLSILAFPSQTLPMEVCEGVLLGALDKIHEAGACLAGGHTIDDDTLKFGLSVTGFASTKNIWTNAGAREGDQLILTKALGTGTITSALKSRDAQDSWVRAAVESMKQLNKVPELIRDLKVNAATDVTGFGLAGHLLQMLRASHVSARLHLENIPALEGALESLKNKNLNRAHKTNLDYVAGDVNYETCPEAMKWLTVDPQTSGGLILSVSKEKSHEIVARLKPVFKNTVVIGEVVKDDSKKIQFA